eukprot:g3410.t1
MLFVSAALVFTTSQVSCAWEHWGLGICDRVPLILTGASNAFGPEIAALTSLRKLLRRAGDAPTAAAIFDGRRPEPLGTSPVRNATGRAYPYKRILPLRVLAGLMFGAERAPELEAEAGAEAGAEPEAEAAMPRLRPPEGMEVWVEQAELRPASRLFRAIDWRVVMQRLFDAPRELIKANLWFGRIKRPFHGSAGDGIRAKESSLHFDGGYDNVLLQLAGVKRFVMFDALQSPLLYPWPMRSILSGDPYNEADGRHPRWEEDMQPNFSPLDITMLSGAGALDLRRFPRAAEARPLVCTLRAGEAMLLGRDTWHAVWSFHGGAAANGTNLNSSVNTAINLWFGSKSAAARARGVLQDAAFEVLMAHNKNTIAPPVPPSNYSHDDESADSDYHAARHGHWDRWQTRYEDGEEEYDRLGCEDRRNPFECVREAVDEALDNDRNTLWNRDHEGDDRDEDEENG